MRSVAGLKRVLVFALAAAGVLMCGCGGGGGGGGLPDPTIRFFNGISDSNLINFFLDDDVEGPQIAYLGSTPGFAREEAEVRDLRIQEDGSSVDLWSEVVTLSKDKHYFVAAFGLINFGTETLKRARFVGIEVDRNAPNGTRAKLIIFHGYNREAGLDTPNIDFQTPGDNPQFKVTDIAYTLAKPLEVDAGNLTFEARRTGTETVLVSRNITLGGGKIYAVFVLGVEGQGGAAAPRIEFLELEPR